MVSSRLIVLEVLLAATRPIWTPLEINFYFNTCLHFGSYILQQLIDSRKAPDSLILYIFIYEGGFVS